MRGVVALTALLIATAVSAQEEVLVERGSAVRYLSNSSDPGLALDWVALDFDDSSWDQGMYGLGYETGTAAVDLIDTSVPTDTLSLYSRAEFTIDDPTTVENLLLGADWDDGWAAWINGVEVHRSAEMPPGGLTWDSDPSLHESSNASAPIYSPVVDLTPLARPLLQPGRNVLAVAVWNANSGSSDLVIVPQLVRDRELAIERGPYLQQATPTSITVRWRTTAPAPSQLSYGRDPGPLSMSVEDPSLKLEHELRIEGLSPGQTWLYQVMGAGLHSFRTPPAVGERAPIRAWVIGDSGTANADARAVRDAYHALHGPQETDLWLMLGDNAYEDGTDSEYQGAVFETYPDMLASVALWPTLGNHDGRSASSADETGAYYDIFTLPRAAEAGGLPSGTEAYYSFDHGNVHFVCLDSFDTDTAPGEAMLVWLADDLAATRQDWVIAFWHHPPYSKGSHDSDTSSGLIDMRERVVPVLEAVGVDLVLSGHSHSYERSVLLDDHTGDSLSFGPAEVVDAGDGNPNGDGEYVKPTPGIAAHEGAVYAVAGSSGKTSDADLDHPAMIVNLLELGSMVLEIDGLRLDALFLDDGGRVRDSFTILKGCVGPPCVETDCSNGLDDDGDGLVDGDDPDCLSIDSDGDGRDDEDDCAPLDATAWSVPGSPATLLVGPPADRLRWTDQAVFAGPGTVHDVFVGMLSELRADGGLDRAACLSPDTAGGSGVHGSLPGVGEAYWYLVRAGNICGDSGLGSSSLGARSLPVDPCP